MQRHLFVSETGGMTLVEKLHGKVQIIAMNEELYPADGKPEHIVGRDCIIITQNARNAFGVQNPFCDIGVERHIE